MEFVVLARKLRPARFEQLIGQDTVVRALRNAILTDRVAHAFLFAGSRGVGKTSTARILTKALNCEQPADGEPCNACDNCREITLNTSPDVYEIDAASNRGIDNIRELRENTKYTPVKSRFKTYIIDEVHMLTMESFNALLKTLEEPPPHVKFILATTNPHRIPDTILSRCQRYDFARIPLAVLTEYLVQVTGREGIRLSHDALQTIARNAAGGVRDALTAVDQVVSFAGQEASDAQVLSILGLTDNREVFTLLGAVLDKDLPAALEAFASIREHGHDLGVLLEAMIREIKDFSLYVSLQGSRTVFAEHPPDTLAFFAERRGQATLDELQQLFYLLLEVEEQIKRSDFAQACFEMGLVKACRVQPLVEIGDLLARVRALDTGSTAGTGGAPPHGAPQPAAAATAAAGASTSAPSASPAGPPRGSGGGSPGAAAAPRAGAPTEFDRIAAGRKARARESAGAAARSAARPQGDRSGGDDGEEAEPGAAASPPVASATAAAPEASAAPAVPAPAPAPAVPTPAPMPPPAGNGSAALAGPPALGTERQRVAPDREDRPATAAGSLPAAPVDEGPALCDDPRWRATVEAVGNANPRLASKLRGAEVTALGTESLELLAADAVNRPSAAELEALAPFLAQHFGAAFPIALADDTKGKAREAHTIAGRNRIVEAARQAARRAAAEGDDQVQRLLRAFPRSRVVEIALGDPPGDRLGDPPGAAAGNGLQERDGRPSDGVSGPAAGSVPPPNRSEDV